MSANNQPLCPGYKHVTGFSGDPEIYEEEEVEYVVLDLGPQVEPALLGSRSLRLIGHETSTPFIQLHGAIFSGQVAPLLGSEILFASTALKPQDTDRQSLLEPFCQVSHHVAFHQVKLEPKVQSSVDLDSQSELPHTSTK